MFDWLDDCWNWLFGEDKKEQEDYKVQFRPDELKQMRAKLDEVSAELAKLEAISDAKVEKEVEEAIQEYSKDNSEAKQEEVSNTGTENKNNDEVNKSEGVNESKQKKQPDNVKQEGELKVA